MPYWVSGNKSSFPRGDYAIWPLLEAPADDSGLCRDRALVTACSPLCGYSGEATSTYRLTPVGIQLPDFGGRPKLQPSHPRFHIAQILGERFFICLSGSSSLSSGAERVHLTSSEEACDFWIHWIRCYLGPKYFLLEPATLALLPAGSSGHTAALKRPALLWSTHPARPGQAGAVCQGEAVASDFSFPGSEVKLSFIGYIRWAAHVCYFNF